MTIIKEPGSYRDPEGGVFYEGGKVYRWVSKTNKTFYLDLIKKSYFKELVEKGFHIDTKLVDLDNSEIISHFDPGVCFFEHKSIDFITFPYEWPRSKIYKAALHTLMLQEDLLVNNLSLKDATPYNIQFNYSQPIFIDFCSIIPASETGIWVAYNQFCQMFIYPLLLDRFKISHLKSFYLNSLDGVILSDTVKALGFKPFWRLGIVIDYLLPALVLKLKTWRSLDVNRYKIPTSRKLKNSIQIQLYMVKRLKKVINKIFSASVSSDWLRYTDICSYSDTESTIKYDFIKMALERNNIKKVLDIGCNTGKFSILSSEMGCDVVAIDTDHECVDLLYNLSAEKNYSILPLCINITNPSPSIGWFNEERKSFLTRIYKRFDCVFALALIHHLMISDRVPMSELPRLFAHCTKRYVIVEYIDLSDKMVQGLLKYRAEKYDNWNRQNFEKEMNSQFNIICKKRIVSPDLLINRCLYLMELRSC